MNQPAIKKDQRPANDPAHEEEVSVVETHLDDIDHFDGTTSIAENPVRRAVDDFRNIIDEMDDLREVLRAHGVPLRTTRMIVEFGVQKNPEKQSMAIDSAMGQAKESFGEGILERRVLENHISTIVDLERDLTHSRDVAREEGLDAQALSMLTQMVQKNPGDGGTKAVNTLLSYALAYGVKTEQLAEMMGNLVQRPTSVFPQIARKPAAATENSRAKLIQDAVVGCFIGVFVIYMLL